MGGKRKGKKINKSSKDVDSIRTCQANSKKAGNYQETGKTAKRVSQADYLKKQKVRKRDK